MPNKLKFAFLIVNAKLTYLYSMFLSQCIFILSAFFLCLRILSHYCSHALISMNSIEKNERKKTNHLNHLFPLFFSILCWFILFLVFFLLDFVFSVDGFCLHASELYLVCTLHYKTLRDLWFFHGKCESLKFQFFLSLLSPRIS